MKDQRFIELLNLYIDRQITAEETAELEAEIQHDPARQAVYHQYCKIHTATKLVYESFRAGASEQPAAGASRAATIELFESRRRRSYWGYYAGGLAAAACLALVFVRQVSPSASHAPLLAAAPKPAVVVTPSTTPQPAAPVREIAATDPVNNPISLRNSAANPDYSALLVALREQDEERALTERWQANRSPSLFDDNLFEAKAGFPANEPRTTRTRNTPSQQAEFTAFQFQR